MHQEEEFKAYVLVKAESGKDLEVFNKIRKLQGKYRLWEVSMLYGDYDIMVKVDIAEPGDLQNFVFEGLRPIQGVVETKTMLIARSLEFK